WAAGPSPRPVSLTVPGRQHDTGSNAGALTVTSAPERFAHDLRCVPRRLRQLRVDPVELVALLAARVRQIVAMPTAVVAPTRRQMEPAHPPAAGRPVDDQGTDEPP